MADLSAYARDPVAFIDRFIRFNELGQPFELLPHQRAVLLAAFAFNADGRLPWDTILYSAVKKSGKTTINGAVTTWWGFTQEAPNELRFGLTVLVQPNSNHQGPDATCYRLTGRAVRLLKLLGRNVDPGAYPTVRYHATRPPVTVDDEDADRALGEGWADSPFQKT